MKKITILKAFFVCLSTSSHAETWDCRYLYNLQQLHRTVTLHAKINVNGEKASLNGASADRLHILQNTEAGLLLSYTNAWSSNIPPQDSALAAEIFAIDKKTSEFLLESVIDGNGGMHSREYKGSCVKSN